LGVAGRPALSTKLSSAEFQRWYWLKAELVDFARSSNIAATGNKPELASRIDAWLDGRSTQAPARRSTISRHSAALPGSTNAHFRSSNEHWRRSVSTD
jgi:hypothetical protein